MEDLIKRSDAIKATWQEPTYTDPLNVLTEVRDRINAIPSVDRLQKVIAQITFDEEKLREIVKEAVERFKEEYEIADRPQGEWIDIGGYEVCKNCHEVKMFPHWNFCPNCGVRTKGIKDE